MKRTKWQLLRTWAMTQRLFVNNALVEKMAELEAQSSMITKSYKQVQAESLLELIKEHKKNCEGMCRINIFSLREIYERMIERPLTKDEEIFY